VVALLVAGLVVPLAIFWFFAKGSSVSSSVRPAMTELWIPVRPNAPSAEQLRGLLRANGQHPTTCAARGTRTAGRTLRIVSWRGWPAPCRTRSWSPARTTA